MKFRFVIAAVTVAALSGCSEKKSDAPILADGNVELFLSVPGTATKVSGVPSSEDAIKDLQVLVFNSKGMLETYKHSNGNSISLTCTAGEKRIAAFVNAGQQSSVGYERELPQLVSDLADNGPGGLVMAGDTSVVLTTSGAAPSMEGLPRYWAAKRKNFCKIIQLYEKVDIISHISTLCGPRSILLKKPH